MAHCICAFTQWSFGEKEDQGTIHLTSIAFEQFVNRHRRGIGKVSALDLISNASRDQSDLILKLQFVIGANSTFDLFSREVGQRGKTNQDNGNIYQEQACPDAFGQQVLHFNLLDRNDSQHCAQSGYKSDFGGQIQVFHAAIGCVHPGCAYLPANRFPRLYQKFRRG